MHTKPHSTMYLTILVFLAHNAAKFK